ncbi:hypothetical protein GA0115257_101731 [Streptomyces sp. LcepLS]|nr:hypothetical protein GA0115257_101731 [Streptomyces sp. LcepLS]
MRGERGDGLGDALAGASRVGEREGEHGGQRVAQVVLAVGAFGGQEADGLLRVAERAPRAGELDDGAAAAFAGQLAAQRPPVERYGLVGAAQ